MLAVGSLNQRFELMGTYDAMTGLRETEAQLLDAKLTAVMAQADPGRQEEPLTRVLQLMDLPDPQTAEGTVNVERLLAARQHEDVVEFRHWLRTLDQATDDEIREQVSSVRERVAGAVHGSAGKAVRLVAAAAADVLPFGGLALGAADVFLLEKILPEPGPVSFLGRIYPSLFKEM